VLRLDHVRSEEDGSANDVERDLLRYPGRATCGAPNVIRRAISLASDVIEPEHLSVLPVDPSLETAATALRGEPAPVDSF